MGYDLGVDLGTTYTAAAVMRDGRAEIVTLGTRSAEIPSVVFLHENGDLLVGEPAERRSALQADRFAREFKRRIGDPTPLLLSGSPFSAHALTARLLRTVVTVVSDGQGGRPQRTVVTCPASWSHYKRDLLEQAIHQADVGAATVVTEPEAAAVHYASTTRVGPGEIIAVYDLGGGTFDATVLRRAAAHFELIGEPRGLEQLGGIQFDEAVFGHVVRQFEQEFARLDPNDAATVSAVVRLRRDCVEAKEALSSDTEVVIPVMLPDLLTEVRLTRGEFEAMIRPALSDTIETMRRAVQSAQVEMDDVTAVLLVGGSSRVPLIAELVTGELRRPVAVDIHPKHAVALGAARLAGSGGAPVATSAGPRPVPVPVPAAPPPQPAARPPDPPVAPPAPVAPAPPAPAACPAPPAPPARPAPVVPAPPAKPAPPAPPAPEEPLVTPVPPAPVKPPAPPARRASPSPPATPPASPPPPPSSPPPTKPAEKPSRLPPSGRARRPALVLGIIAVVAAVGGLGRVLAGGGDDGGATQGAVELPPCEEALPSGPGGDLVDQSVLADGAPEHIDPALTVSPASYQIVDALYDGLTGLPSEDSGAGGVVPQVAESYEANGEASVWTFTIREGLRFSNGEAVLPSSFVRAWERASDPDLASPEAFLFGIIEGGQAKLDGTAGTISGLAADDAARTLRVALAEPVANFDAMVGFQPFMPMPEAVEQLDAGVAWEDTAMVGNGPFMLASPRTATEITLVRNPEWNGNCYAEDLRLPGQPVLDQVTFRAPEPGTSGYDAVAAGEAHSGRVPSGSLQEARERYGDTLGGPFISTYLLVVNWDDPVVGGSENRLLRQAISLAIDRASISEVRSEGTSRMATGITTPVIPGFAPGLCDYCTFDLAAAREAFVAWQDEGHELRDPIRVQSAAGPGGRDPAMVDVLDNLEEIGIAAVEEPLAPETYFAQLADGRCQVCGLGGFASYLSYDSLLSELFHGQAIGRTNFGRFSDPEFDELVDEAGATVDPEEQAELYRSAEQLLLNDAVGAMPILWESQPYVYGDQVESFPVTALGQIVWERVALRG